MHGLINRSFQAFLGDTYGPALWSDVAAAAGIGPEGFEAMLQYDDAVTEAVVTAAQDRLAKPRDVLLEDFGAFLVSIERLRRLLRFGGVDYLEFLHSLHELPDRARLAVDDIGLPPLELICRETNQYALVCHTDNPGYVPVFAGILRAMADDYGDFVLVDIGTGEAAGTVRVELLQTRYATGRAFDLAGPGGA